MTTATGAIDPAAGDNRVTSFEYGPLDNGPLQLGLSSGHLLSLDPLTLNRVNLQHVFSHGGPGAAISKITMDPLNMIILGSKDGKVSAYEVIKQEKQYVYVDLGENQYATLTVENNE